MIRPGKYDAIDLGCAHGNTVLHARQSFGARKILGIDRRGVHRKDAAKHRFDFMKADVMEMFLPASEHEQGGTVVPIWMKTRLR